MAVKILVIEDNPDILFILDYLLLEGGYEVVSASDSSAIEQLDEIKPNLIILDELLTDVRGSELCTVIKSTDHTSHIPVMLISAHPNIKTFAEACKADAYLEKPFEIQEFLDLIRQLTTDDIAAGK